METIFWNRRQHYCFSGVGWTCRVSHQIPPPIQNNILHVRNYVKYSVIWRNRGLERVLVLLLTALLLTFDRIINLVLDVPAIINSILQQGLMFTWVGWRLTESGCQCFLLVWLNCEELLQPRLSVKINNVNADTKLKPNLILRQIIL